MVYLHSHNLTCRLLGHWAWDTHGDQLQLRLPVHQLVLVLAALQGASARWVFTHFRKPQHTYNWQQQHTSVLTYCLLSQPRSPLIVSSSCPLVF